MNDFESAATAREFFIGSKWKDRAGRVWVVEAFNSTGNRVIIRRDGTPDSLAYRNLDGTIGGPPLLGDIVGANSEPLKKEFYVYLLKDAYGALCITTKEFDVPKEYFSFGTLIAKRKILLTEGEGIP